MKKIVKTEQAPAPVGPYNQAVISGPFVFTAGQVAIDPVTNQFIGGSVEEQARQVMKNLGAVLEAAGSDFSRVVKTTIFLRDMGDFAKVNAVYGEYFTDSAPARSTVAVSGLPLDVQVEIECIAEVGNG